MVMVRNPALLAELWDDMAMLGAHHARRLQSGRLGTYVAYLVGLVVALLAAAKLGWIG